MNDENAQSMEQQKRLLLALILSAGIVVVWQSFQSAVAPPPLDGSGEGSGEVVAQGVDGSGDVAPVVPSERPEVESLPPQRLRGTHASIEITNAGARLSRVEITQPEKFIPHTEMRGPFPQEGAEDLSLALVAERLPELDADSLYAFDAEASVPADGGAWSSLVYRWTSADGLIEITRTYRAGDRPFGAVMELAITNRGGAARRLGSLDIELVGDIPQQTGGFLASMGGGAAMSEAVCLAGDGAERAMSRKLDESESFPGPVRFVAVDERYFMTAIAPRTPDGTPTDAPACSWRPLDGERFAARLSLGDVTIEPGASETSHWSFTLYTGPKAREFLEPYLHGFEESIDMGWWAFLAMPIRWLLLLLQKFVVNWGLAIIALTIVIKLITLPLTAHSLKNMEKMRVIQPRLQALQKKYENDKTKLAEEQMKLFRETGTSPFGGCLPMFLQMPVYIALYRTIAASAELYRAPFALWIHDLSQRDPIFVLPLLMGGVMFIQQRMMPQAVDNPQIRVMNNIMPIIFTVMMLFLPSGLVLYIFVNMLLGILQQLYIRRRMPPVASTSPAKS